MNGKWETWLEEKRGRPSNEEQRGSGNEDILSTMKLGEEVLEIIPNHVVKGKAWWKIFW
jgi:hypothetical protein